MGGRRNDSLPGAYEWWYFDAILDGVTGEREGEAIYKMIFDGSTYQFNAE